MDDDEAPSAFRSRFSHVPPSRSSRGSTAGTPASVSRVHVNVGAAGRGVGAAAARAGSMSPAGSDTSSTSSSVLSSYERGAQNGQVRSRTAPRGASHRAGGNNLVSLFDDEDRGHDDGDPENARMRRELDRLKAEIARAGAELRDGSFGADEPLEARSEPHDLDVELPGGFGHHHLVANGGGYPTTVDFPDDILLQDSARKRVGFADEVGISIGDELDREHTFTFVSGNPDSNRGGKGRGLSSAQVSQKEAKYKKLLVEQQKLLKNIQGENDRLRSEKQRLEASLDEQVLLAQQQANQHNAGAEVFRNLEAYMANNENMQKIEDRAKRGKRQRRALALGAIDEDEVELEIGNVRATCCYRAQLFLKGVFRSARSWLVPFGPDVDYMFARYGRAIGVYFGFFRWMALASSNLSWGTEFIPAFFLFSSYTSSEALAFSVALVGVIIYFACVGIMRVVREEQILREDELERAEEQQHKYSRLTLNIWDHSLRTARAAEDFRLSVTEGINILEADRTREERKRTRSNKEWVSLIIRRSITNTIVALLILATWMILIYLNIAKTSIEAQFSDSLQSLGQFVVPTAIVITNALMPEVVFFLTHFEKWDDPEARLKWLVARFFVLKMMTVILVLFQNYQLLTGFSITVLGITSSVDPTLSCRMDNVGINLASLLAVTWASNKLLWAVRYSVFKIRSYFSNNMVQKKEFQVSFQVINLLYFQILVWCVIPFAPVVSIVGAGMLMVDFKVQKFVVKNLLKKTDSYSANQTGAFFMVLYAITFVMAAVVFMFVLDWHVSSSCGPLTTESFLTHLQSVLAEYSVSHAFYVVLSSPIFLWGLVAVLVTVYLKRAYFMDVLQGYLLLQRKRQKREILELQARLKRQREIIARLQENEDDFEDGAGGGATDASGLASAGPTGRNSSARPLGDASVAWEDDVR